MTDGSGVVVWSADYKPFGEATITVSTITNNLRFPGQYFDAETGTLYNYFRDYNPAIGRYIESDPLGIRGGMNHLNVYADNNPINFTDPDGLCPNPLDFGWTYSMVGPNKATDYQYQSQDKERRVGKLTYANGKCDCQNKTLQCNYDIFESQHSRKRSYNKTTKQYGAWSAWDPGYDDRFIGTAIIEYNCKDKSYILRGVMTF